MHSFCRTILPIFNTGKLCEDIAHHLVVSNMCLNSRFIVVIVLLSFHFASDYLEIRFSIHNDSQTNYQTQGRIQTLGARGTMPSHRSFAVYMTRGQKALISYISWLYTSHLHRSVEKIRARPSPPYRTGKCFLLYISSSSSSMVMVLTRAERITYIEKE